MNVDVMWYLFESLASQQWQPDIASGPFVCPSPNPYDLHAPSPCADQFRDSYHPNSYYSHIVCSNCQCSDHDVNSCPLYVISNDSFIILNHMIDVIDEQNAKFENSLREYDLSHETDLRFISARLDVNTCDDGVSFPPLESALKEVLDPPPTISPIVAPSLLSTLGDTTKDVLSLTISPLTVALYTKLKVGESFRDDASMYSEDDSLA